MKNFVLINPFEVPEDIEDERFLEGWSRAADFMRSRPGFVASQLHRAVSPNPRFRFVNVAEWESPQDFQAAVRSPEFQAIVAAGTEVRLPAASSSEETGHALSRATRTNRRPGHSQEWAPR